jgi:hypothetical protein
MLRQVATVEFLAAKTIVISIITIIKTIEASDTDP